MSLQVGGQETGTATQDVFQAQASQWRGGGGLVAQPCPTRATAWTVGHQAPLPMGFPRQDYCSGLPCPSPGDLPDPGMEPASPALAGGFFTTEPPGKPLKLTDNNKILLLSLLCIGKIHTDFVEQFAAENFKIQLYI